MAVLVVTLVGIKISCSREKEKQKSRKTFVRGGKFGLSGGLYKMPHRIGLDLGKKNVNKNTFGITAKALFVKPVTLSMLLKIEDHHCYL